MRVVLLGIVLMMLLPMQAQAAECSVHDGMGRFFQGFGHDKAAACHHARKHCHHWHERNRGNHGLCGWGERPQRHNVRCSVRDHNGHSWTRWGHSAGQACANARRACHSWHEEQGGYYGWCGAQWIH